MKMSFHSHANKTHFHMKGCAPGLALKKRHQTTRKWPIYLNKLVVEQFLNFKLKKFSLLPGNLATLSTQVAELIEGIWGAYVKWLKSLI